MYRHLWQAYGTCVFDLGPKGLQLDAGPFYPAGLRATVRYQVTPRAAVGVRYERLDDDGLFGGIDQCDRRQRSCRSSPVRPAATIVAVPSTRRS